MIPISREHHLIPMSREYHIIHMRREYSIVSINGLVPSDMKPIAWNNIDQVL